MSVIWSGITEEGAVVPVQVTAEGKVVAVGDGPAGDYLPITGGNLTGDLTIDTDKITLNANGHGVFGTSAATRAQLNSALGSFLGQNGSTAVYRVDKNGNVDIGGAIGGNESTNSANNPNIALKADGNILANDKIRSGGNPNNGSAAGVLLNPNGNIQATRINGPGTVFQGYTVGTSTATSVINADGTASFSGDVVIGSKGSKWLIRESNGVAMLIEQTLRKTEAKVRDLPNELDLIEAALNEVMEKLRMTPPAGWPVWDGQSEVTSDNDNA